MQASCRCPTMFDNKGYIQRGTRQRVFYSVHSSSHSKKSKTQKNRCATVNLNTYHKFLLSTTQHLRKFDKILTNLCRPYSFKFYSLDTNEYTLFNKIENGRKDAKGYELFLALLFGKTTTEIQTLREYAEHASVDRRFADTCFIVFDAPFGEKSMSVLLNIRQNAKCAQKFNFTDQYQVHVKNAAIFSPTISLRMCVVKISICIWEKVIIRIRLQNSPLRLIVSLRHDCFAKVQKRWSYVWVNLKPIGRKNLPKRLCS